MQNHGADVPHAAQFCPFLAMGLELDRLCGAHLFTSNNDSAQILPLCGTDFVVGREKRAN